MSRAKACGMYIVIYTIGDLILDVSIILFLSFYIFPILCHRVWFWGIGGYLSHSLSRFTKESFRACVDSHDRRSKRVCIFGMTWFKGRDIRNINDDEEQYNT
jgi:hypothetical protein